MIIKSFKIACLITSVLNLLPSVDAKRILAVYPIPSLSHQIIFRPLTLELVKRGYEVVVITTHPAFTKEDAPSNLTEIDVSKEMSEIWLKNLSPTFTGRENDQIHQFTVIIKSENMLVDALLGIKELQDMVKSKTKFDLLLLEACVQPVLIFSHMFQAPVVQVSSFGAVRNYEIVGAPRHPFLYPEMTRQKTYNLSFWEKIKEIRKQYLLNNVYLNQNKYDVEMWQRNIGENTPDISVLTNNVEMLLLNINPIFHGAYPVPFSLIHMWGVRRPLQGVRELPQELEHFLNSSTNGVIYMSFGSSVLPSALPPEKMKIFIEVLSQLPYDVLLKWDQEKLPVEAENIRIGKWFPQADVLRHPKVKLFITQGGLQSTEEAIYAGVPMVGIPIFTDQWGNTEKYVHHRIGVQVDFETVTIKRFKNAIDTVLRDDSYRANVIKLKELLIDQPQQPLERVMWGLNRVLRDDGSRHLRAPAANMHWTCYYEVELFIILLITFLCVAAICVKIVFIIYGFIVNLLW